MNGKPEAILVDLDGTVCILNRDPLAFAGLISDLPNEAVIDLIKKEGKKGIKILLLTGRPQKFEFHTRQWLIKYNVPYNELHMKPKGEDHIRSDIYKERMLHEYIIPNFTIKWAIDDNTKVLAMLKKNNIKTIRVDENGKFKV